ncbi:MAG: rod shape-determining protein MreC [Bacteroidetes bacterium]|nr:rod shape-determining protein MreC [Bacteroidota bacterium]MBU2584392.1 rod shape-determining protein MreC [Bacteroidota bacterium]
MIQWLIRFVNDYRPYIILSLLITASLLLITFNKTSQLVFVRQVSIGFYGIVKNIILPIEEVATLKKDVEDLQEINVNLISELHSMRSSNEEVIELRRLLQFRDKNRQDFIAARVLSKVSTSTKNRFFIDVGKNSGVIIYSPVLTDAGVVGLIDLVSDDESVVQTINNLEFNISVRNARSKTLGILKWDGKRFAITNISKSGDVKEGDIFNTSEFSTIFPGDIPIARVKSIYHEGGGSFFDIEAEPTVDINNIRNVLIPSNPQLLKKKKLNFLIESE